MRYVTENSQAGDMSFAHLCIDSFGGGMMRRELKKHIEITNMMMLNWISLLMRRSRQTRECSRSVMECSRLSLIHI